MQVKTIQNNSSKPVFKSRVHMNFSDARCLGKSLTNEILILQHNGQDDVVFITHHNHLGEFENELSIDIVKKEKNNFILGHCKQFISKVLERNGLIKMYEEAKTNMKPIENNPIYSIL